MACSRHVLLAPGHPGNRQHPGRARKNDSRVVHAYEPHEYAHDVAVVGAGMAAATEWLNALAAGAQVISVRRREPQRRPLNVPRRLLLAPRAGRLPAPRSRASAPEAPELLAPSYPPGPRWDEPLGDAGREGGSGLSSSSNGAVGDLCDRLQARLRTTPVARAAVEEHGLDDAPPLDCPRGGCGWSRRSPGNGRTLALAGRSRAVGVPCSRHARRYEVDRAVTSSGGWLVSYTLRGRIEIAARSSRPAGRARRAAIYALLDRQVVAGRGGRARCWQSVWPSTRRCTTGCSRTSRAGWPCRSARSSSG